MARNGKHRSFWGKGPKNGTKIGPAALPHPRRNEGCAKITKTGVPGRGYRNSPPSGTILANPSPRRHIPFQAGRRQRLGVIDCQLPVVRDSRKLRGRNRPGLALFAQSLQPEVFCFRGSTYSTRFVKWLATRNEKVPPAFPAGVTDCGGSPPPLHKRFPHS